MCRRAGKHGLYHETRPPQVALEAVQGVDLDRVIKLLLVVLHWEASRDRVSKEQTKLCLRACEGRQGLGDGCGSFCMSGTMQYWGVSWSLPTRASSVIVYGCPRDSPPGRPPSTRTPRRALFMQGAIAGATPNVRYSAAAAKAPARRRRRTVLVANPGNQIEKNRRHSVGVVSRSPRCIMHVTLPSLAMGFVTSHTTTRSRARMWRWKKTS
jgi:hypothetical protein